MSRNIVNMDNLIKKLTVLGKDVPKILEKTIEKQALFIKDEAKDLVPVDTGDLRQSIKHKIKRTNSKIVGTVYTNQKYAAYVEFGTGKVGEATNTNKEVNLAYKQEKWLGNIPDVGFRWISGQPAQPFIYPALKNNIDKVTDNIKEDLKSELRRISND